MFIQYYLNNRSPLTESRMPTPVPLDAAFVVLVVVVASIFEYVYFWPRFRADVAAERPGARTRAYRRGVIGQWGFGLAALAIWRVYARPWSALGLTLPHGWRAVLSAVIVLAGLALLALQLWSVLRLPIARRVAARRQLGEVAFMLPRTRGEASWFLVLSATAGFCEELLYRGYLPWFFARWIGMVGAMALVVVIYGVSHIYQGRQGAIKATIAGAIMAAIVLASGSLIPAIILHALIDAGGGSVGYYVLRDYPIAKVDTPVAPGDNGVSESVSTSDVPREDLRRLQDTPPPTRGAGH
jgi:membrane protease YdiL (CAAX protease family)